MAGYNPNENPNDYFSNEYINFNQFLQQHNIGSAIQFYGNNAPYGFGNQPDMNNTEVLNEQVLNTPLLPDTIQYFPRQFMPLVQQQQQQQQQLSMNPLNDTQFNEELARNSNLLPTANEFVPNFVMPASDLNLYSNTYDMMQQPVPLPLQFNQQYIDPNLFNYGFNLMQTDPVYNLNSNKNNNALESKNSASTDKPDLKDKQEKQKEVLEALKAAKIDDATASDVDTNANRTALTSAGGAIKKVRPTNSGNSNGNNSSQDTQDRISGKYICLLNNNF